MNKDLLTTMIKILDIIEDTTVDGPGFRTTIYCAGCAHRCEKCHNKHSWDFNQGKDVSTDELMKVIVADPYANVTFSGGDPMYQAEGFAELAKASLVQRRISGVILDSHLSHCFVCQNRENCLS